jgi:hypothetical protein
MRVLGFVVALLVVGAACSSPGVPTKLTCSFTLGSESAPRVVLNSRSTVRTPLGVDHLTGQVSRQAGIIRLSVFGSSPKDHFTMGSGGGASRFSASVPEGMLHGSCR